MFSFGEIRFVQKITKKAEPIFQVFSLKMDFICEYFSLHKVEAQYLRTVRPKKSNLFGLNAIANRFLDLLKEEKKMRKTEGKSPTQNKEF